MPQLTIQACKTDQTTKINLAPALQTTQVSAGQSLYVNTSSQTSSAMALKLGVVPIISAPSNAATVRRSM